MLFWLNNAKKWLPVDQGGTMTETARQLVLKSFHMHANRAQEEYEMHASDLERSRRGWRRLRFWRSRQISRELKLRRAQIQRIEQAAQDLENGNPGPAIQELDRIIAYLQSIPSFEVRTGGDPNIVTIDAVYNPDHPALALRRELEGLRQDLYVLLTENAPSF